MQQDGLNAHRIQVYEHVYKCVIGYAYFLQDNQRDDAINNKKQQ